jgi:phenylpyruvate tautomerase PptA (4-oxalocrotonate tautomerase family)
VQQRLAKSAKHYIVEAYCKPPFATEELDAILQRYGVDKSTREGIVAETRRGVAARIERDAQLAKLSPKAGFLDTTPTTGLGADPRLRAKVKANFAAPLAEEVLDVLRKATGVTLTRADDIQNKHYVAGSYSFNDNPAWQVMEMLAASKYVQGKWEADGDGYRLVRNGKPVAEPSPPPKFKSTSAPKAPAKGGPQAPASNFNFWLTVASITAIVLIAVAIGWRRWRNSPPSTPNLPDSTGAQGE